MEATETPQTPGGYRAELHRIVDQIQDSEVLRVMCQLLASQIVTVKTPIDNKQQVEVKEEPKEEGNIYPNLTPELLASTQYTSLYPTQAERDDAERERQLRYAKAPKEKGRPFINEMKLETYSDCYDSNTTDIEVFYSRETKDEIDLTKRIVAGRYVMDSMGQRFKLHNSLESILWGVNGISRRVLTDSQGEQFIFMAVQGAKFGIKASISDEDSEYINPKDGKPFKRTTHELILPPAKPYCQPPPRAW